MRRPLPKARNKDMIMSSDEKNHGTPIGSGEATGVLDESAERTQIDDFQGGSSSSAIAVERADILSTRKKKSHDSQLQELIFPKRLMAILSDPANADCIRWGPDGSSFFIVDKDIFARKIMPRLSTRQAKFTSFVRKLNRWGFSFVTKGPATGHYRHDYFHRDKPFLVSQMYYHNSRAKEALKGTGRSTSSGDEKQGNQVFDDSKVSSDRNLIRDARIERQLMASSSHHIYNAPIISQGGGSLSSAELLKESSEKSVVIRQRHLVDPGQPNRDNHHVFAEQPTAFLHHRLNPTGIHNAPSLHRHGLRDLITPNDSGASNNDQDPRLCSWSNHNLGVMPGSHAWPNFGVGADQPSLILQTKDMEFTHESLSQSLARAPGNPLVLLNDTRLQQEGNLHPSGLATMTGYNDPVQFLAQPLHHSSSTNQDERILGQFGQRISGSILPLSFPSIHAPMMPGDRLPMSLNSSEVLHPSAATFLESPQLAMVQQSMMGMQNFPQDGAGRPARLAETSLLNLDLRPFLPSSMVYPIGNSQASLQPSGVRNHRGGEPSFNSKGPSSGLDDEKLSKQK